MQSKTKVDLVEDIVLKYAENNANTLSSSMRNQLRQDIISVLYQVSAQSHPVIDVVAQLHSIGLSPPELKPCPFCGSRAVYGVSQARFLKPELVNLYLIAGCRNCGITCQLFKIENDLLAACKAAASKWNSRAGGDV